MSERHKPRVGTSAESIRLQKHNEEAVQLNAEERIAEKLALFCKTAEVGRYEGSTRKYIKFTVHSETEFVEAGLLLSLIDIDPWPDKENLSFTIDNHFDIESLIERGILPVSKLSNKEKDLLEESEEGYISAYIASEYKLPDMKPIPDLFVGTDQWKKSPFEDVTEEKENVEKYHYHGNTSYLYSIYRKKYRRELGGRVYRKLGKGHEKEVSVEEQNEMLQQAKDGDEKVRNEYLTMNIGLVYFVALNMGRKFPQVNLADLIQEALIAMNKCIDSFSNTTGKDVQKWKFSTYAVPSMEWTIIRFIKETSGAVRIPQYESSNFSKVDRIQTGLAGRKQSREEVIKQIYTLLVISEYDATKLLDRKEALWQAEYVDIDELSEEDEGEFLQDENGEPEKSANQNELRELTANVLDSLTPRQAKIVRLRFGIDCEEKTLEEIGGMYNLSRNRIRQIEAKALRYLRHPSISERLKETLP